jgi:hypothetical protein
MSLSTHIRVPYLPGQNPPAAQRPNLYSVDLS